MIKKTVRDQVYTLSTYLKYVNDGDICENADVQRLAGNFDNREVNEIIYTVLTSDHIPELILAECNEDNCTYIADGLQRTTMLKAFRNGQKITSAIDDPIVWYMKKKRDENGNVKKNERGQVEFEEAQYDIRNKTYEMLPEELKKVFDDYQIRIVIHEDCTKKRISQLIKRYNYQRPMTASQKAFTYMDNFAVKTRAISNMKFFVECEGYSEKEKINGTMERVVAESVMCMFHLDTWKKSAKDACDYLNQNANKNEFEEFEQIIERLGNIITPDYFSVFTSKNSFIWFKLFYKFSELGLEDAKFSDFVRAFNGGLKDKIIDGLDEAKAIYECTYAKLDKEKNTKDKSVVLTKIKVLEKLMMEYFGVQDEIQEQPVNETEFISETVGVETEVVQQDMDFYKDMLQDLEDKTIRDGSKLLNEENRFSLLALVAYSVKEEIELDNWMRAYAERNNTYYKDQKKNYLHMKAELDKFVTEKSRRVG